MKTLISKPVGKGGANVRADVLMVQRLLNDWLAREGSTLLVVDAIVGPKTGGAILAFQKAAGTVPDGRLDPGGAGLRRLFDSHLANLAGMFQTEGVNSCLSAGAAIAPVEIDMSALLNRYEAALRSG